MLQMNTGSIWIGQKVMERINEENQTNQRRNFLVRLTVDKVKPAAHVQSSPMISCRSLYYFVACAMVQHGGNAIPSILRSGSDIQFRSFVFNQIRFARLPLCHCAHHWQINVRRSFDDIVAAQCIHGNQIVVLRYLAGIHCTHCIHIHNHTIPCVERFALVLFPECMARRSGCHSTNTRTTIQSK